MVENKFTQKQIIQALRSTGGFIVRAAEALGCHYVTMERYIKTDPDVAEALRDIKENRLDVAENVIMVTMEGEDSKEAMDAAKFYLRYKGQGRGYIKTAKVSITEDLSKLMQSADERMNND